jgi:thiamine biosynthesis lipoprotein
MDRQALPGPARVGVLIIWTWGVAVAMADDAAWYGETRDLWAGIPVTVRFAPRDGVLAERIWDQLRTIDAVFNDWRDDSEIGRINAGGVATHVLSADLAEAFALAARMRAATDGAFEVTVGPLRRLWRGAEAAGVWPEAAALAAVRQVVGPQTYRCDGTRLEVRQAGVRFDFGGLCKGMAVDRVAALLRAGGATAGMVQIGGETGCWGLASSGRTHRIGIPHPEAPDDADRLWARVQDDGGGFCISTSGNYRNPVVVAGRTLYHLYDPRSGMPTDTQVLSVTVLFPGQGRNGEADGLTKAGIVLGPAGLASIARVGAEALMLVRGDDGRITEHQTPGWGRFAVDAR